MIITTVVIMILFFSSIYVSIELLNSPDNKIIHETQPIVAPDELQKQDDSNSAVLYFEVGYEIVPPAPEIWHTSIIPDKPHPDGIPPLTERYKDPTFLTSRTRGGGPTVINETVLLLLVNFSDVAPQRSVEELEDAIFNNTPGANSVHNYYKEVSYGTCNIIPGYLNGAAGSAWLKVPQSRKYYGKDNTTVEYLRDDGILEDGKWRNGKGFLVEHALMAADNAGVNFSKYDNDGPDGFPNSSDDDGKVDHVLIIYSGNGQNHYGTDNTTDDPGPDDDFGLNDWGRDLIWPSRVGDYFGTYDGKNVFSATLNPEDINFILPIGVTCHEFGHDLGLKDLYDIDDGSSVVGDWELMDVGNYNTNSTGDPRPAHIGAFGKEQLGWVKPIVINETNNNQGFHQVNQTTSATNESVCYKVKIKNDNEYYLIENRNTTVGTYEEGLPGRGILIWHVDNDMNPQINNTGPPYHSYYGVLLENPKNDGDLENYRLNKAWAHWNSSGTADQADFNVTTTPNSSANGGTPSNIYIDRIQDNALWNMTVRILVNTDTDPPGPPKNVQVTDEANDNGQTVNITWVASRDDGGNDSDVLLYHIYINDSSGMGPPTVLIKSVTATQAITYSTLVTGLKDGVMYNFTVRADDGPNLSPWPGNFTVIPLDNIARPVSNFQAMDTYPDDGGNITLTWDLSPDDPVANASGPADIIWYNIYINDTGQGEGGTKHTYVSLGPGNTSYQVWNLVNNVPYYFNVSAIDDVFNQGYSPEKNATPMDEYIGMPINIRVTPNTWTNVSSFTIEWINPMENSGIVEAYYKMDTAPTGNGDYTDYVTGTDVDTIIITGPLTDGSHRVYVWLRDGEGNRNYSRYAFVDLLYDGTPPSAPVGLAATPAGWSATNSFMVNWNNPSDASGIKGAYYSIDSPPITFNDGTYTPQNNINQLSGIVVPGEGEHTIYVWLRDNANNANHTAYASVKLYYDRTPPRAPQDIKVTPNSWTNVNSFNITWTNPSDLSGIIGARYKLIMPPLHKYDGIVVPGVNINSIQNIKSLYPGNRTLYLWLVDNASNADHLNTNTTYLHFDNLPPSPPGYVQAFPGYWTANNSFIINWSNPPDYSGIAGVYYKFNSEPNSFDDGVYVAGVHIEELRNLTVPRNGTNTIYIWVRDVAGNVNHLNYSTEDLYYDGLAPEPPLSMTPHPTQIWTSNNSFAVNWTNPNDLSGISGAYYKLDSPPTSHTDGTFLKKTYITYIESISVSGSGAHTIYVWLVDRVNNVNYLNYSTTQLLFDNSPPGPLLNLTVEPSGWKDSNSFNLSWTNPREDSGIYGLYYWFSPPTENLGKLVIQNDISSLTDVAIPGQGEYTIYIWLIDNAYNMDYRNNVTQKLRFDISSPTILHSRLSYATKGSPITITAIVNDVFSGVDKVILFYKHESDSNYIEKQMNRTGNIFSGEIPAAFVTEESIGYFLYACDRTDKPNIAYYDSNGHTSYKPGPTTDIDITITEEDFIPPVILHEKVTRGTAGVKIALTATVSDDGSGVKEVKVYYRAKGTVTFQEGLMTNGKPYIYEIPANVVTTAGLEYYLYAVDNSWRNNVVYFGRDGPTTVDPMSDNRFIEVEITSDDSNAPNIIYGPEAINITSTTAIIHWVTDEPSDSLVDYGLNVNYTLSKLDTQYITIHLLMLTDLNPETTYHFKVSCTDQFNNGPTVSEDSQFRTTRAGEEDTDGDGLTDSDDPDDDNDNIPDDWELLHNLDPKNPADADIDLDNDGYSNLREYLSDSDPRDATSTPVSIRDTRAPILIHEPITRAEIYHSIIFSATAVDNGSGIQAVTLHYKTKSDTDYTIIIMPYSGEYIYTYELPGSKVTGDLEYYLEARDAAFVPNVIYYGKDGATQTQPTKDTDINIDVVDRRKDDDDDDEDILGDLGKPFGITNPGICLLVLIVGIILIICFFLSIRSAYQARALEKHASRHKTTTADGEKLIWEGDELEELDEVDDLETAHVKGKYEDLEGL